MIMKQGVNLVHG